MTERLKSYCAKFIFVFSAMLALACSGTTAFAADLPNAVSGPILVLPFQINAGAGHENLQGDLPELLAQRLVGRGISVIPVDRTMEILRNRKVTALDLGTVRTLIKDAGAVGAVYGAFQQIGTTYSIDARVVEAGPDKMVKPLFVEQQGKFNLVAAVEDLAARVAAEVLKADTIAQVEVRGTKVLDPDVVLMRINTKKGDPINPETIDREVKRIWDLGYFSDVTVALEQRDEGLALIYTVTEKPRIESIAVEGASDVSESDILSAMSNKAGSILNDKLLAQDLQKVQELYRKEGYYLATVNYRIDTRQGGAAASLILEIKEGNKLYIQEVRLEGVEQLKKGDVEDQLSIKERGLFSFITGTGVLKEEMLERDSAALTAYYMNNGFMDVAVGAAKVVYEEKGIIVTYPINEGPRYKLGTIKFAGDLIDTDEALYKVTKLDDVAKDNGYYSLKGMQDDTTAITDFYAEYGYAFANVLPHPEKREGDEHIVDLTYVIEKRQKVYVHQVILEGNNRTRDNVVLREMRILDGDPFKGSALRRSIERLNKLGYFELAEAELVPTKNEEEVDLKIKLKERSTGAVVGGLGYSTYSSFGVSGTIMENNLWGKGYSLSFQALFSGTRTAYTLSFTNPHYNDTPLSIGADIYDWKDDYLDYTKKTTGGVIRAGYPIGEYSSIGLGYRLDFYNLGHFSDYASPLIRDYAGDRITSALIGRLARDTTNKERPDTGNIDRIGLEYAGGVIGGDDKFITLTLEHQTYFKLRENHIAHFRVKGSAVFENGDPTVPVFERFWMGGMDSVRGYRSQDIVPRDPVTGDRIGGTRMAFANFEYIWTFSPEVGLNLVPFFDIGANIATDQEYKWSDSIKRSAGLEMRWRSPMGDLRFSYGVPFDNDWKGDKLSGRFEFSMGQFF